MRKKRRKRGAGAGGGKKRKRKKKSQFIVSKKITLSHQIEEKDAEKGRNTKNTRKIFEIEEGEKKLGRFLTENKRNKKKRILTNKE